MNIVITGATTGIGRHLAFDLAKHGHRVFATGRRTATLEAIRVEAEGLGLAIVPVVLDVESSESIQKAARTIFGALGDGGVDVLINNAGYGQAGPLLEVDDATLRRQFETNVFGLMEVTRAFAPSMVRRGRGTILNVSSTGGRLTAPVFGAYHASKYALEALSDALRMELAPFGVRVVVIEPGPIHSEFAERAVASLPADEATSSLYGAVYARSQALETRMKRLSVGPQHVARVVRRAIAARWPRARYIAPVWLEIPFFLLPFVPTFLMDALFRHLLGLTRHSIDGARSLPAQSSAR